MDGIMAGGVKKGGYDDVLRFWRKFRKFTIGEA